MAETANRYHISRLLPNGQGKMKQDRSTYIMAKVIPNGPAGIELSPTLWSTTNPIPSSMLSSTNTINKKLCTSVTRQ